MPPDSTEHCPAHFRNLLHQYKEIHRSFERQGVILDWMKSYNSNDSQEIKDRDRWRGYCSKFLANSVVVARSNRQKWLKTRV